MDATAHVEMVGRLSLYEGDLLRLVQDSATGHGWVERWNWYRWVKPGDGPGPLVSWFSGRHPTDAELLRHGALCHARAPVEVLGEPVLAGGTVLRLVRLATAWVETWDGSRWAAPSTGAGAVTDFFAGRRMTAEELGRLAIVPPDPARPMPQAF